VPTALILAGIIAACVIVAVLIFKLMLRVAEPNQALLISGARHRTECIDEGLGFRIITCRG